MRGLVIRNTGSSYLVRSDDGHDQECRIKGTFRIKGSSDLYTIAGIDFAQKHTNPNDYEQKAANKSYATDIGKTTAENCQLLCRDCNRRKGGK